MHVELYTSENSSDWNSWVATSKNGTFLHKRSYMDYHKDRFLDSSLLVKDNKRLIAVLPSHREGDFLYSHAGLSYGGWIVNETMTVGKMREVFRTFLEWAKLNRIKSLFYKTIPRCYHKTESEEDIYTLFELGAEIVVRDAIFVLTHANLTPNRRRAFDKAKSRNYRVVESDDLLSFMLQLEETLAERHNAKPVHTTEELNRLKSNFPGNIKLYICTEGEELLAGAVLYQTDTVTHTQYLFCSEKGRKSEALTFLLGTLIQQNDKLWFSLGSSRDKKTNALDEGLTFYKESFGARLMVQDLYRLDI